MSLNQEEMRDIFERTRVIRRPTYGIIRGYHELPYVCLGESCERGFTTTKVRGKVQVSPQFVIRPSHYSSTYGEIFGDENVDIALSGRIFGYMGFRSRPVECKSEHLEVNHLNASIDSALSSTLDELERHEDISTGVILTPDSRYYLISIERFITTILDDELNARA